LRSKASWLADDAEAPDATGFADVRRTAGGALSRIPRMEGSRMSSSRRAGHRALAVVAACAVALVIALSPSPAPALAQGGTVTLEWFGWSHFRLTSVNGKVLLINPFLTNPDSTMSLDDLATADMILPADGHGDEIGQTFEIAQKTNARVFAPFELGTHFMARGLPMTQVIRSNPGNWTNLDGIKIRMVNSVHGSGLALQDGAISQGYSGPAAGFYITFENNWTVYFTGSSAATQDQALWASNYKPDAMIFHMAASADPTDVATAIKLTNTDNPNLTTLIPHHHRVQVPAGGTTVADVQGALGTMGITTPITEPVRSQVYTFTK
jgi:L-ascorbate metabolism protein UlaG (beta-lactamase superfamily)